MREARAAPLGRACALVLLLALLGTWYVAEDGARTFNAWQAFPKLDVLLLLCAATGLLVPRSLAQLGAGCVAAATIAWKWLDPPAYVGIRPQIALFVGLIAAMGLALGGALRGDRDEAGAAGIAEPTSTGRARAWWELAAIVVPITAILTLTLGDYVADGGFDTVGWGHAALVQNTADPGFLNKDAFAHLGYRPLAAPYLGVLHGVLGQDQSAHVIWSLVLAGAASLVTFLVLRMLGVDLLAAVAVALLMLVFPRSGAVRFGTAHSIANLAVVLYGLGLAATLHGLRLQRRRALAWHAAGLACFVAMLLAFELAAGAVAVGVVLYRLRVTTWRAAARRWVWDLVALVATIGFVRVGEGSRPLVGAADQLDHARLIADQALELAAAVVAPFGAVPVPGALATALTLLALGVAVAARGRTALRRPLALAAAGAALVVVGYGPFVAAGDYYSPLQGGEADRVNTIPAIGYCLVVTGLLLVAAQLAFAHRLRALARPVVAAGAVALGLGYAAWQEDHERLVVRAVDQQQAIVDLLRERLPDLPEGTRVLLFGVPRYLVEGEGADQRGWTTFTEDWDLTGVLRLVQRDDSLYALPAERDPLVCGPDGASLTRFPDPQPYADRFVVVDTITDSISSFDDLAGCRRVAAQVAGLPLELLDVR